MATDQELRRDLSDEAFLARFEVHDLPDFSHVDHIRMALAYARRGGSGSPALADH